MIIGIVGTILSGKNVLFEYLKQKGYSCYSLSDEVREIAKENGIEDTRKNLKELTNKLMQESPDSSILTLRVLKKIDNDKINIINEIREPLTIKEIKRFTDDFILIGIDAPQEVRYQRCKDRNRATDPQTFEDFVELDDSENYDVNIAQQIYRCMDLADYTIINDGTKEEFYKKIDEVLARIKTK